MITIFCDFRHFSAKKWRFFSKTNVTIKILHHLALFCRKIWRKYLKNQNIGPRLGEFSPIG
jgi:hypothetical protein